MGGSEGPQNGWLSDGVPWQSGSPHPALQMGPAIPGMGRGATILYPGPFRQGVGWVQPEEGQSGSRDHWVQLAS